MFMALEQNQRRISRFTWAAAWFALVIGQLHALARHRTDDGRSDLDLPLTRAWAEPAGDLLSPLLDWASPDAVYLTYGKLWLPVFIAFTLGAIAVRGTRRPAGFEKWAWRIALTGYVGACFSVAGEYWLMWTGINDAILDPVFLASIPFMLLTMLGSTLLGISLLRKGVGLPAWLLVTAVPGMLLIPEITSLGNVVLPIVFAFAIWGHRLGRASPEVHASHHTGRPAMTEPA